MDTYDLDEEEAYRPPRGVRRTGPTVGSARYYSLRHPSLSEPSLNGSYFAPHVIQTHVMNPCFLSRMASYDVASNIWQALHTGAR